MYQKYLFYTLSELGSRPSGMRVWPSGMLENSKLSKHNNWPSFARLNAALETSALIWEAAETARRLQVNTYQARYMAYHT